MRVRDRYVLSVIIDMIVYTILSRMVVNLNFFESIKGVAFGIILLVFILYYAFDYILRGYSIGKVVFRVRVVPKYPNLKYNFLRFYYRRILETFYIYLFLFGRKVSIEELTKTKVVSSIKN